MPSTLNLRRRIRSIKNTSQITKAMEMVAAAKMRRAQLNALGGRPYQQQLVQLLSQVVNHPKSLGHSLMKSHPESKLGIILFTSNKSLCGALNTNLFRLIQRQLPDKAVKYYTVGLKGRNFILKTDRQLTADFDNPERIVYRQVIQLRKMIIADFLAGRIDQVAIVYPSFVSTLVQEPKILPILPITRQMLTDWLTANKAELGLKNGQNGLIEPGVEDITNYALNHFIELMIYQAWLEAKASEYSARMIAMQNATSNAKDLVSELTLSYNQIRQEAITAELLEITSASAALE